MLVQVAYEAQQSKPVILVRMLLAPSHHLLKHIVWQLGKQATIHSEIVSNGHTDTPENAGCIHTTMLITRLKQTLNCIV